MNTNKNTEAATEKFFSKTNNTLRDLVDGAGSAKSRVERVVDDLFCALPAEASGADQNDPSGACDTTEHLLRRLRAQISGLHLEIDRLENLV